MKTARILAPAKVNLGLSILGKRDDGYHEIDTIMAMIGLCDKITISRGTTGISIAGMDDVPVESNLMTKAAIAWGNAANIEPIWHIEIAKRIPSPAGIGGGSSDAAAVLLALNALHSQPLKREELHEIAAGIGADCPFFLGEPCARATGTGTQLRPLYAPSGWIVLVVPFTDFSAKTKTLYGSLTPDDYMTSQPIDAIEQQLESGNTPTGMLQNSFYRHALRAFSGLEEIAKSVTSVTGSCSLSGAGPALYAIAKDMAQGEAWSEKLVAALPENARVISAPFLTNRPKPRAVK